MRIRHAGDEGLEAIAGHVEQELSASIRPLGDALADHDEPLPWAVPVHFLDLDARNGSGLPSCIIMAADLLDVRAQLGSYDVRNPFAIKQIKQRAILGT